MAEYARVHYKNTIVYTETAINALGATTSTTLRTVTAHDDDTSIYVRKFGDPYEITQVTDIEDPVDTDMTFAVYALDGTLLGSRLGGGAFVAGTTLSTAQASYLKITATGNCTVLTGITVDTDVDPAGIDFVCPAEVLTNGMSINLYLSSTTSTYYDSALMYGGARHTPDGTSSLPYFKIQTGLDACTSYKPICTVLDSLTYDEELTFDGLWTLQAALGYTPKIISGIGARVTREVQHDGNNLDTAYVSSTGSDSTGTGTWALPYLTIGAANTNIGARTYINVKDSLQYSETAINLAVSLEPIYGEVPEFRASATSSYAGIRLNYLISGFLLNLYSVATSNYGGISPTTNNCSISDCTISKYLICYMGFKNYNSGGYTTVSGVSIQRNVFQNVTTGIFFNSDCTGTIQKNIFRNCTNGIYATQGWACDITNNLLYSNAYGIRLYLNGKTISISNNTLAKNGYGINISGSSASGATITKLISYNSTTYDLYSSITISITYTDYGTNSGFTISTGCITTDPNFCDLTNNGYGLSADSGALKTDGAEGDMGAVLCSIRISASTATINGFYIDGNEQYFNAIGKTGATDYTGLTVKWCSIYDYNGIAIDDYSGATTTTTISNCLIHDNGNGIRFARGGNTISETVIYANDVYGVWSDYSVQSYDHCIFSKNYYGIYFESNTGGVSITNSVFDLNSYYDIYSEVSIILTYCCVTGSVNSNVDISDSSNTIDSPLFVSVSDGAEDYRLRRIELGYNNNSPLIDQGDDGYDIGAYKFTYDTTSYSWKKYDLEFNPQSVKWINRAKNLVEFNSASGSIDHFVSNHKRGLLLDFGSNVSSAELRDKVDYFHTLVKGRELNLTEEQTHFRLHLQPTSFEDYGSGVVTASSKSLFASAKTWTENKWRGYHVGVKFTSGTGLVIDSSAKTGTKSGAGWTVNAWAGYYLYNNGYYYYIASNTATALTLLDPDSTLTSETVSYAIEKYFKIRYNTSNVLYLSDDDSELTSGTYDWYIDFIECKLINFTNSFQQTRFMHTREHSKIGYSLEFEEI